MNSDLMQYLSDRINASTDATSTTPERALKSLKDMPFTYKKIPK